MEAILATPGVQARLEALWHGQVLKTIVGSSGRQSGGLGPGDDNNTASLLLQAAEINSIKSRPLMTFAVSRCVDLLLLSQDA